MRKYPIGYWHGVLLEFVCFFAGHKWKSSWRRKANAKELMEMDYDTLPYDLRKSGNAYYEYSPHWHYKCRRCRFCTRDAAWHPWYKKLWWAFGNGIRDAVWNGKYLLGDREADAMRSWIVVIPMMLLSFCKGFFSMFDRTPLCLWTVPADGMHHLFRWVEVKCPTCKKTKYENEFCSNAFHVSE